MKLSSPEILEYESKRVWRGALPGIIILPEGMALKISKSLFGKLSAPEARARRALQDGVANARHSLVVAEIRGNVRGEIVAKSESSATTGRNTLPPQRQAAIIVSGGECFRREAASC